MLAAGGVGLALALVLLGLAIGNETSALEATRDAVQAKASSLESFDKKVTAAQADLAAAQAEAESLSALLKTRQAAVRRMNAVRGALVPGMWIQSWGDGKLTIRYWKDRVKLAPGKTASESFKEKLRGKPEVDESSVKIADMSAVGTGGACEQFTVEVKFK